MMGRGRGVGVAYSVDGLAGEGVFDVAALAAAGVRRV